MKFKVPYRTVAFFTGITMKLFMISDSKGLKSSSNEDDLTHEYTITDKLKMMPNFHQLTTLASEKANTAVPSSTALKPESVVDSSNEHLDVGLQINQYFKNLPNYIPDQAQNDELIQKCVPLRTSFLIRDLPNILSYELFSQTDPIYYLLSKTIQLSDEKISSVDFEVGFALGQKKLSQCYIPFANVLSSFLKFWILLLKTKLNIAQIQVQRSANVDGYTSLPIDIISSPDVSELFSSDIFSDPKPPLILFNKIMNMSEDTIAKSKNHLHNFLQEWVGKYKAPFSLAYVRYANAVYSLFRDESVLKNFKQNLDGILQKLNFGKV